MYIKQASAIAVLCMGMYCFAEATHKWPLDRNSTSIISEEGTSQPASHTKEALLNGSLPVPSVQVIVGSEEALTFLPTVVEAPVGTIIQFNFLGLNHTLTQSNLNHPCEDTGGFDTGFQQFNPSNELGKYIVEYTVQTKEPQWFYCAQVVPKSHCKAGMVFALNPGNRTEEFVRNISNNVSENLHNSTQSDSPEATTFYDNPSPVDLSFYSNSTQVSDVSELPTIPTVTKPGTFSGLPTISISNHSTQTNFSDVLLSSESPVFRYSPIISITLLALIFSTML